jgi:Ser/Thr protein kinase RdoA (MazF antagonist)
LHTSGALRKIVRSAVTVFDNADGAFVDSLGRAVRPFVVTPKGENLDAWARRRMPTLQTALQALTRIAERIEVMHATGVVHRDLKPENVLWIPRRRQWTLVDFGCAAREKAVCPLTYSIRYALAFQGGRPKMQLCIWVEALSHVSVYRAGCSS